MNVLEGLVFVGGPVFGDECLIHQGALEQAIGLEPLPDARAFLAIIAVIPTVISTTLTGDFAIASFFGGTSLLIIVSVALDLVQKIDSHLIMRSYSGLLDTEE